MTKDFYEFDHRCEKMPENVSFCKIKNASSSQFTYEKYEQGIANEAFTLYRFKYCPYCGAEVVGDD